VTDFGASTEEADEPIPKLSAVLYSEQAMADLLDMIVGLAVTALANVGAASVSYVAGGDTRPETISATSPHVRDVDAAQYRGGGGPCVQAIETGTEVRVAVPTDRWPEFSAAAQAAGVRSVWSLPLVVGATTTGALNLYSLTGPAPHHPAATSARLLAAFAAVVLANSANRAEVEMTNARLRSSLETRGVIAQAKGILMASEDISGEAAFDILRRASQRTNRKLRDIATELVANWPRSATDA
jgi:transcriptional regulator with GAF, ATPase, and Fis domain